MSNTELNTTALGAACDAFMSTQNDVATLTNGVRLGMASAIQAYETAKHSDLKVRVMDPILQSCSELGLVPKHPMFWTASLKEDLELYRSLVEFAEVSLIMLGEFNKGFIHALPFYGTGIYGSGVQWRITDTLSIQDRGEASRIVRSILSLYPDIRPHLFHFFYETEHAEDSTFGVRIKPRSAKPGLKSVLDLAMDSVNTSCVGSPWGDLEIHGGSDSYDD